MHINHIVFLVGSYYPYASANGNCAGKIAEEFANKGFRVSVLCQKNSINLPNEELLNGCRVIRLSTSFNNLMLKVFDISSRGGLSGIFCKCIYHFMRFLKWSKVILGKSSTNKAWYNAFYEGLSSIHSSKGDGLLLIPLCFPFEGCYAAATYHRENLGILMIPWLLDMYANSATLHRNNMNRRMKYNRHIAQELYVLKESDSVVYLSSWGKHLESLLGSDMNHCHEIGLPLANLNESKVYNKRTEGNIEIVYLGSLLKDERNPSVALGVFASLASMYSDFKFSIYHMGNCDKIIDNYSTRYPSQIINCGSVENSRAEEIRNNADVLVLIGNAHAIQIPSKTFEYLSTGKPILFFVKDDKDPILELLHEYGNVMIIKESKAGEVDLNALYSFLRDGASLCGNLRSFLEKNTPTYIANYLLNLV